FEERVVQFHRRSQFFQSVGSRWRRYSLEMNTDTFVNAALRRPIQPLPGDAADDRVQVVAVGGPVPAEQTAILQLRQGRVQTLPPPLAQHIARPPPTSRAAGSSWGGDRRGGGVGCPPARPLPPGRAGERDGPRPCPPPPPGGGGENAGVFSPGRRSPGGARR